MTSNSLWSQCVVPDPADPTLPCGSSLLRLLDSHQLQPCCVLSVCWHHDNSITPL